MVTFLRRSKCSPAAPALRFRKRCGCSKCSLGNLPFATRTLRPAWRETRPENSPGHRKSAASLAEEARADSQKVVNDHWVVVCFIYDHTGAKVDTISNKKELNKYGAAIYSLILLGIVFCALAGMGLVWILYKIWLLFAPLSPSAHELTVSGWLYWLSYATAGLLLVASLVYLRFRWIINRAVSRTHAKLRSAISPEDKKRFQELNYLHLSRDPSERERFVKLSSEYQEKIREALKK